ncbi:MAG: LamG-like jellyroll fold domain-containing protein [Planctomycetota bacterium]
MNRIYIHYGYDYRVRLPAAQGRVGCTSCGASAGPMSPGGVGRLPELHITRVLRPASPVPRASRTFGANSSLSLSPVLRVHASSTLGTRVNVQSPTATGQQAVAFDAAQGSPLNDGIFLAYASQMREVRGYDAFWTVNGDTHTNAGALTSDLAQIRAVEVIFRDGRRWCFDLFPSPGGGSTPSFEGRILRRENANGVGFSFTYQQPLPPAPGAPADLNLCYALDRVTDAYGRSASFTYGTPVGGSYPATRIDLPDGRFIIYQYDTSGRLQQVDHPDGSASTFGYQDDPNDPNLKQYLIYDVAADPGHRRKTVSFTKAIWQSGSNPPVGQVDNRLVKIYNGAGELAYSNWERDLSGSNSTVYAYYGGNLLKRIEQKEGQLQSLEFATNVVLGPGGVLDPSATSWEFVKRFSPFPFRMPRDQIDALGRERTFQCDTGRRLYTAAGFPDNSSSARAYHPDFNWLMQSTDRLGRKTVYTRDAAGNVLTKTAADGTPAEATETWTYNAVGQCETYTDANGNVTEYFYSSTGDPQAIDGVGYLVKAVAPADRPGDPRAELTYAYDVTITASGGGKLVSATDAEGRTTAYAYGERNRLSTVTYADGSTERLVYGAVGSGDENILVETVDRNGNREVCTFDAADRETSCVEAFGTPEAVATITAYLTGTQKVLTRTRHGETTTYVYDARNRVVATQVAPDGGTSLTTSVAYDAAQRRRSSTDPYGRSTYTVYDINDRPTRVVTETLGGSVSLPQPDDTPAHIAANDAYLLALPRAADGTAGANATYLVEDRVYDAEGQLTSVTDPRNLRTTFAYDAQGRRTTVTEAFGTALAATTETLYDPHGNVTEVRSPRNFDNADANGFGNARTVMTYTGRNLLASRTAAPGTPDAATETYTYFLDRRPDTTTDARGHDFSRLWGVCCARIMAVIDPPAPGSNGTGSFRGATITRHDFHGNVTHTGRVADVDSVAFPNTPANPTVLTDLPDTSGGTLQETTTRYDARHRPVATTTWLVPLLAVDPDSVPIAGGSLPGDPAVEIGGVVQGLTTLYTYDDDLTDGSGLDNTYSAVIATKLPAGFFASGSDGYGIAVTNPEGETTARFVDGLGRTVLTVDPTGDAATADYDTLTFAPGIFTDPTSGATSGGLLLTAVATDPLGHTQKSQTDGAGRTLRTIDAENHATNHRYDGNANRVSFRDPAPGNGVGEDCVFDSRNREIECRDTQELAESTVRLTAYDANSNVVQTTDAKGATQSFVYDARDRQTSHTDRINATTAYTYDENSNPLTITDAEDGVTSYTYDPRNLQTETAYPGHNPASLVGDADYDRVAVTHDALHRPAVKTDQLGETCTHVYDLAGRLIAKQYRDAAATGAEPKPGPIHRWRLDEISGTVAADPAGGKDTTLLNGAAFDPAAGVIGGAATLDGNNDTLQTPWISLGQEFSYAAWFRVRPGETNIQTLLANKNGGAAVDGFSLTVNRWNTNDRDLLLNTGNGTASAVAGSAPGLVTLGQWYHVAATFDRNAGRGKVYLDGTLTVDEPILTDFKTAGPIRFGSFLNDYWDFGGELDDIRLYDRLLTAAEAQALASPNPGPPTDTDTFTYDRASRLLTAESERYGNTVTYAYTDDSLIASENIRGNVSSNPAGYTHLRGYDAADRLTSITYPNGSLVTRTYTDRNQLATITRDADGTSGGGLATSVASFTYDPAMRETARALGNGLTRTTAYGRSDHLPTAMTVETGPGLNDRPGLGWSTYGYDANKNLSAATSGGLMNGYSFTTQQDAEDRLTQWARTNAESQSFGLSLVGDWNTYNGDRLENGVLTAFNETRQHNDVHEILEIDDGTITPLEHDAKGNLTLDDEGRTYTWDFENRLKEVRDSNGDLLVSCTYDALGRRVTKTAPGTAGGPSSTTAFVHLTDDSGMGQLLAEYEDNALKRQYTYGEYIDEAITLTNYDAGLPGGEETLYYHRDRQYNVIGLTDSSGGVVERYAYGPYGERRILASDGVTVRQVSAYGNPLGHQGLYHDNETGLIKNGARYRDPRIGRFISRDPSGYVDGPHLYLLLTSRPLNLLDPTGRRVVAKFRVNTLPTLLKASRQFYSQQRKVRLGHQRQHMARLHQAMAANPGLTFIAGGGVGGGGGGFKQFGKGGGYLGSSPGGSGGGSSGSSFGSGGYQLKPCPVKCGGVEKNVNDPNSTGWACCGNETKGTWWKPAQNKDKCCVNGNIFDNAPRYTLKPYFGNLAACEIANASKDSNDLVWKGALIGTIIGSPGGWGGAGAGALAGSGIGGIIESLLPSAKEYCLENACSN